MVSLATPEHRPAAPKPGEILEGRYRLDGPLGEGGVGWVYRAEHLQLGSQVAVKMLQTRFAESSMMRPRFTREARAMAALRHPHIVTITDFSVAEGRPYIVMELLEGLSLREVMDEGPFDPERARRVILRVLDGLAYAHNQGFIHRDLKPDNIFLLDLPSDDSFPKILDFGFVKLTSDEEQPATAEVLTRSGIAFGTPAYMSPEQATGAPADPRSDLYALGIVFFEMLVGRRPYEGSLPEIVRKHLTAPVPTFDQVGASRRESQELRRFLLCAMAKEPDERFADAAAMKAALLALPEAYLVSADAAPRASVSTEAPTVAAVVPSRPGPRADAERADTVHEGTSPWKLAVLALVFASAIGAIAVMVALAASWTEDIVPEVPRLRGSPEDFETGFDPVAGDGKPNPAPASSDAPSIHTVPADEAIGEAAERELADEPESELSEEELRAQEEVIPVEAMTPEEVAQDERAAEEAVAEAAAVEPAAPSPEATRVNPWQARRSISWMTRARRRVLRGRNLGHATEEACKRFARSHREDPRPHLLLAQSYRARGWDRSALERYDLARRVAVTAVGDPRMKTDLVRMAASSSVADRAAEMVQSIYGAEALETVEQELESPRHDAAAKARLRRLASRFN